MAHLVGSVLAVVTAVLAAACALLYGLGFRWWRDRTGWHLLAFMAVIATIAAVQAVDLLVDEGVGWFVGVRLVAFGLAPPVLAWRLAILVRALPGERRRRREWRGHRCRG